MASKVDRIVARLRQKIADGDYYEAQQQTRVAASRYVKTRSWPAAVDVLAGVAQDLLRAGQGGAAGDLCVMLVDVYRQAELRPDSATKGRLLTCLRLFEADEPTRAKFIGEMIGCAPPPPPLPPRVRPGLASADSRTPSSWSAKLGDYPAGDPELHHVAGSLYVEEHDTYEAERHLLLGTRDSPAVLVKMEYEWYKEGDAHLAPHFAARAVLGYLLVGNVGAANSCYRLFTDSLRADNAGLGVQDVSSAHCQLPVFPSLPLVNFLGLLLAAVQRGTPEVYRGLVAKYAGHIDEAEAWTEPLEVVAEMYFGISRPRQSNPLMDMMNGLLGGASQQPPRRALRSVEAPAPAGLD